MTKATHRVLTSPYFLGLVLVRLLQPLLIFSYPVATTIWAFIIDFVDGDYLEITLSIKKPLYETFDKIMDHWWLTIVMLYLYSIATPLWPIFLFLYIYRSFGFVAFLIFNRRWLLLLFPNIFEVLFHFFILVPLFVPVDFSNQLFLITLLGIIIAFSFLKEYMLHVVEFDLVNWKKVLTSWWRMIKKALR